MKPRRWKSGRSALAATLFAFATQASAQVLDIDEHGTVVVFNGPTQYLSPDLRSARAIPRAARRALPVVGTGRNVSPRYPAGATPRATVAAAIGAAARQQNLDVALITAVARTESGLDNRAVSSKGAVGVMQLMPGTAQALGVDPTDPADNVRGGAAYLRQLLRRYDGDIVKTLAAYNAGPGAVDRHNGAPQYRETQGYISAVLERMAQSVVPVAPPSALRNRRP
jgi:soluble lytic murein transglycosylase-like protein